MLRTALGVLLLILLAIVCLAQGPALPQDARAVLRLKAKARIGETTRSISRKRFFLIKGSLEQNKPLIEAIAQQPFISRDCYYRRIGASDSLLKWLRDYDCESVYCRELTADDIDGSKAVAEFKTAFDLGLKELRSRETAQRWLTVYLPENIRDGFYKQRRDALQSLIAKAEAQSGAKVLSVMTDRNGTAYFTELEPGAYVISNLAPIELESTSLLWTCEVNVKQDDRAFEKPFQISNRNDKNVKCVAIEKPLPVCGAANR